MNLFLSITFSAEAIIRAFSWTLLHSLWLGILLSLLTGAILLLTRKTAPLLRYNLLASTLVLFVIAVVVTFITSLVPATTGVDPVVVKISPIQTHRLSGDLPLLKNNPNAITQAVRFVNMNANWIVLTWLVIMGYKFVRLGFGFYKMNQLKKRQIFSAGEYWNNRVTELCRQLRVNKKVKLIQSGIIRIPAVIGYFKPVILFPAAILTSMPVNEVEAILIHELGHIRRRDFLMNFLQNMVEIIFFFNPAVLWISSLIKTERENCCDDIAIAHTKNKQDYIRALITFQQFNLPATQQLAIAFSSESNHLLNRVKRMVEHNNKTLNNMEKKFLSAGLVLATVCLCAFISIKAQSIQKSNPSDLSNKTDKTNSARHINDTISIYKIGGNTNMTGTTHTIFEGKEYNMEIKNSIVTELVINGNKIPAEKIIDYKTILDKIHSGMIASSKKNMKESEQAMRDDEEAIKDSDRAMRDSEKAVRDSEEAMRDSEKAMKDSEVAMRESEKAMKDSEQAMGEMDRLIDELVATKIIKNKSELKSLSLNVNELMVNGVKQPAAIHKKLKDKYVKSKTVTLWYETK